MLIGQQATGRVVVRTETLGTRAIRARTIQRTRTTIVLFVVGRDQTRIDVLERVRCSWVTSSLYFKREEHREDKVPTTKGVFSCAAAAVDVCSSMGVVIAF